jgi:hypothetical protein
VSVSREAPFEGFDETSVLRDFGGSLLNGHVLIAEIN